MRVLVVTAVPVERDAVTRAFGGTPETVALPGAELHRLGAFDVLAGGAGPAAAAAATAFALASGSSAPEPYGLVVSAGIGGAFTPLTPLGSLVVASDIVAADLGADTPDGFLPVTALGFGRDRFAPPPALVRKVAATTGAAMRPVLTVSTVTGTAERAGCPARRAPGGAGRGDGGLRGRGGRRAGRGARTGAASRVERRGPPRPGRLAHRRRADGAHGGVREDGTRTGRLEPA